MHIGENEFQEILNDISYIDYLFIEVIGEDSCTVSLSNKQEITVIASLDKILEMIHNASINYHFPSIVDYVNEVLAINGELVADVKDDVIIFKDGIEIKNSYENGAVLVDDYQLPLYVLEEHLMYRFH